ncbi:MAG: formate--tetrahydrofolate ligase [Acidobacteriota bacterium]
MSRNASARPIIEVAEGLGIKREDVILYGSDKAKIRTEATARVIQSGRKPGKLILVSAITPTDAGEGKTTISIGLAQGLARTGEKVCLALREPSLGPTFGLKGGATGGGRSSLVPADDINLHFTGDFHAVSTAHNLLAALLDNHIHHDNPLEIDPRRVLWRRVIDLNDRALRQVVIGLGGVLQGVPRETGFDITPASEVMAILCLAENAEDLRQRLSRILVAFTYDKKPVTAADLKAVGSMMILLRDAMLPNLVQTCEGVPAFVHGGPFANIAHGCNSVIATKMAIAHADWVITEAGFGFDLGAEKFFDIKCTSANLDTAAVVLVATVRALKLHGGGKRDELDKPDPVAVERGLGNLTKHIENIKTFCEPPIVALNRFPADTGDEIAIVRRACDGIGVPFAEAEVFTRGGEGGVELARQVMTQAEKSSRHFCPLYNWSEPIKVKIEKIARLMYGASDVLYTKEAERDLKLIRQLGYEELAVCVAKTQKSLSEDPTMVGRPEDFEITVRQIILAGGAGYVVPLIGDIIRMPGLPASPKAERVDLLEGRIMGLS